MRILVNFLSIHFATDYGSEILMMGLSQNSILALEGQQLWSMIWENSFFIWYKETFAESISADVC